MLEKMEKNVRMREASEGIRGSERPRLLKPEDQLFMILVKGALGRKSLKILNSKIFTYFIII
jgi:hypothetical protein